MTINCNFFSSLASFAWNLYKSDQLILSSHNGKVYKIFLLSCSSFFFWTFILVFPFHGNVYSVIVQRIFHLLIISFSKSKNTQNVTTLPTFHDWNSYFCPTFQNFVAYFIPAFSMKGTWKPTQINLHKCTGWSGPSLSANCLKALLMCWYHISNLVTKQEWITYSCSTSVYLYAKNRFEKSARIFSRQHKQTTFSDAVFLGALRVKETGCTWQIFYHFKQERTSVTSCLLSCTPVYILKMLF